MPAWFVFVSVTHHSITSYIAMDGYLLGGLCVGVGGQSSYVE